MYIFIFHVRVHASEHTSITVQNCGNGEALNVVPQGPVFQSCSGIIDECAKTTQHELGHTLQHFL